MATAGAAQRFGKFDLLEEIGHGGMATVHRAVLHGVGGFARQLVIKRIRPELASEGRFVQMFIEEAKLSALLDHPNIVQVSDFGQVEDTYFLAMEFIEGISLHKLARRFRRPNLMPVNAITYVVHQVCVGLSYAHNMRRDGKTLVVVHRDVSPANILVSVFGAVKLVDFGIAKAVAAVDREETRTGLKGKWSYMSPEQVDGRPVTPRSDIFSTGIVLWEALTGRRLFKGKTEYQTLSNVVTAEVVPPRSFRPEVPPTLEAICLKALARDPAARFPTAEAMADELEAVLQTHPCGAGQLAALVAPILARPTIEQELPPDHESSSAPELSVQVEPSASKTGPPTPIAAAPSALSTVLTSVPTRETPQDVAPRRTLPFVIASLVLLAAAVVITAIALRPAGRGTNLVIVSAGNAKTPPSSAATARTRVGADAGLAPARAASRPSSRPTVERIEVKVRTARLTPKGTKPKRRPTKARTPNLKEGDLADPYR